MQYLKEDIQEKILHIAEEVFSEKGYKDASMREIASRTGITVSNIYHYFTNKDEIFRTILKPVLNDLYVKIYRHDANQMSIEVFTNSDYQQESVQEYIDLVSEHRARLRMLLSRHRDHPWKTSVRSIPINEKVCLPLAVAVLLLSNIAQRKLSVRQIEAKINAGNRLEEYLQGIRVMKAYNLLGGKFERLKMAYSDLRRACIRQEALLGPFILFSVTLIRAGLTFMILCGTYLLIGGELSLLTFVMFLVVGSRVFDPLTSALTNFAEFRYFSIAGGRILTLMNESEMKGNRDVPESGDITFDHVSFGYQEKEILHDISVTLRKGTLTALVGPSGSGKSTMLKLCARFYDPHKGSVRFNGMDMKELELESLMKHCSMVFQDVYLF